MLNPVRKHRREPTDELFARRKVSRRFHVTCGMIGLLIMYISYSWLAFNGPGVFANADGQRFSRLAIDVLFHKVHVVKDYRRDTFFVAIEGQVNSRWPAGEHPDWVERNGDALFIDFGEGYSVETAGKRTVINIPTVGAIVAVVSDESVEISLPWEDTEIPSWVRASSLKLDVRPQFDRRVQVSRARVEVHRYFFGWENFWFSFNSPFAGLSLAELGRAVMFDSRIDPAVPNWHLVVEDFLNNSDWQHRMIIRAVLETFLMAILGTLTGAILAFLFAFLAAANFTPAVLVRFFVRRIFDFVRTVDSLIWSLIFIRAFGLGPLTGAFAIAITDMGALGKLFSETLESIDRRQHEGVVSTGASSFQVRRYGVLPQIMPVFVSQVLYYFEANIRSATIIGALGAGGVGLMLVQLINTGRDWEKVTYLVLLILILVAVVDAASSRLRRRLISGVTPTLQKKEK